MRSWREEDMQFKTYRTLKGFELTWTPSDGIERKILKLAVFLNPDRDACFVYFLPESSTPGRSVIVKKARLPEILTEEKTQVSCFGTDILAFVVDKPHRGVPIIVMRLKPEINEHLARARYSDLPIPVSDAERVLNEWQREVLS